jgi:hypothetical protein
MYSHAKSFVGLLYLGNNYAIGFEDTPGDALMLVPPLASSFVGMVLVA